jgi:hypothetical protein
MKMERQMAQEDKSFGQLGGYPSREWELRGEKKIKDRE